MAFIYISTRPWISLCRPSPGGQWDDAVLVRSRVLNLLAVRLEWAACTRVPIRIWLVRSSVVQPPITNETAVRQRPQNKVPYLGPVDIFKCTYLVCSIQYEFHLRAIICTYVTVRGTDLLKSRTSKIACEKLNDGSSISHIFVPTGIQPCYFWTYRKHAFADNRKTC